MALLVRDDVKTTRVQEFIEDLSGRPGVHDLRLGGLQLEELRSYVGEHAALQRLYEISEGMPKTVDALLEALPSNVETLFERKLQGLSSAARRPLFALAVLGQEASVAQLSQVSGQETQELARALQELRAARIVERSIHGGEFRFAFCWRGDREACKLAVPQDEQRRLHSAFARLFAGEGPQRVAYHQLRSEEPQRGVPLAIRAAEHHALAGSFDAAVSTLEDALPHASGELQRAVLERLCELAPLAGLTGRALRYAKALEEALPEGQRFSAVIRAAELHNAVGDHERCLSALETAEPMDEAQRARKMACASEAHYQLGQLEDAERRASGGLQLAQSPRSKIGAAQPAGQDRAVQGRSPDEAIAFFEQTLQCAQRSGLRAEEARALINLGIVQLRKERAEEAERKLFEGVEMARQANDLSLLAIGTLSAGAYLYKRAELGRAIDAYRECKRLFRRLGNRTQLARALHNLGILYLVCGDLSRARSHNSEAIRLAELSGAERILASALMLEGSILGELGELERGETRLREGMLLRRKLGVERPLEAMIELGELHLLAGDFERVRAIIEEVEQVLPTLDNALFVARSALLDGRVRSGEPDVEALLSDAKRTFERLDRKLWARDAEVALGRHHHKAGRPEIARMHLLGAQKLQEAVAQTLPQPLRNSFERARPQRAVFEALEALSGPAARSAPRPKKSAHPTIIGRSSKLARVFKIIERVAPSDSTVLICGESGTGKELVAEAIHRSSPRAGEPFVKLNCAALVESLLLSELFGHEKGAFTGAHQRKIGRFEMAAGGTLFLDEIGDISPKTQVSLLRVLQEREFERVGGGKPIKVQARIIVATNKNLAQMVAEGTFREDLYYRLKGLTVDLPALRERPEDIPLLVEHFLAQYAAESGAALKRFDEPAQHMLQQHPWPGNIRELENVVRSVALFAEGAHITARELEEHSELTPASAQAAPAPEPAPEGLGEQDLLSEIFEQGATLAQLKIKIQREAIKRALRLNKGNITRAAQALGMKRPRLSQIINSEAELKLLCQEVSR